MNGIPVYPLSKNGERPYLAVPEATFWGLFFGHFCYFSAPVFISYIQINNTTLEFNYGQLRFILTSYHSISTPITTYTILNFFFLHTTPTDIRCSIQITNTAKDLCCSSSSHTVYPHAFPPVTPTPTCICELLVDWVCVSSPSKTKSRIRIIARPLSCIRELVRHW